MSRRNAKALWAKAVAVWLAVLLLAGCAGRSTGAPRQPVASPTPETEPQRPEPTPAPTESPATVHAKTKRGMTYGSVALLSEPTVLVSVYAETPRGEGWDEAAVAHTQKELRCAVDWLEKQAAEYGVQTTLYCDDGTAATADLRCMVELGNIVAGGEDSDESDALLLELDTWCAELDTEALRSAYGVENVGFLYFLPVAGCSFTMVHYEEDGQDFYHEYSCLYRYDATTPGKPEETATVYAHEILHLFGAPDLYPGSPDPFVTDALCDYVQTSYPDEIMYDTMGEGNAVVYSQIDKYISPMVAYRLGLVQSCPELTLFPALGDWMPGVFGLGEEAQELLPPGTVAV